MKKLLFFFTVTVVALLSTGNIVKAQQYKLRQSSTMMGMKTESTIYVKGMRKRTESAGMMGMPAPPVTIEQCDKQRTIKINDKKKLYFIEPFTKEAEEVIDEDAKPSVPKTKPAPVVKTTPQKGGTITMWYNITDTGERKQIYGFTARHVWTKQKMKPSPDACSMKDSIIIKTDGWYIDLPQFNCPVRYRPSRSMQPTEQPKPDCQDKFVTRRSGKGKLGFPITETTTIIMGGQNQQISQFETTSETLEFSAAKLDSMLFEIPPGYTLAASEDELQEKFDMGDMMKQAKNGIPGLQQMQVTEQKKTGVIRIGVYQPTGDEQVQNEAMQQRLVNSLFDGKVEAVAITTEEDAKKMNCDYLLNTSFTKIKQGSKVGGLLKAIKNTDPNAASSFNIDASLTLVKFSDGSIFTQQTVSGKYEGKIADAAGKALDDGSRKILGALK